MLQTNSPHVYNPDRALPEELIEDFVVRTKLFESIYHDIKDTKFKDLDQNYIIQGLRGQGKTTLLLRLFYEISKDKILQKSIVPIRLNEEEWGIRKLYQLWEKVAEHLENISGFENVNDEIESIEYNDITEYEIDCFNCIDKAIKKNKKKIVLFIDNITDLLNKFTDKEERRLREILTEKPGIRIIGASSIFYHKQYDYSKPFYEFFTIKTLKGLTKLETETLLLQLAKKYNRHNIPKLIKNKPEKIEALRRLTGGVIRTIVLLLDIFADEDDGKAFADLERTLDLVTPLYRAY